MEVAILNLLCFSFFFFDIDDDEQCCKVHVHVLLQTDIGIQGLNLRHLNDAYTITTGCVICIMSLYNYLRQNYGEFMSQFIMQVETFLIFLHLISHHRNIWLRAELKVFYLSIISFSVSLHLSVFLINVSLIWIHYYS